MGTEYLALAAAGAILLLVFVFVIRSVASSPLDGTAHRPGVAELSADKYRPLARLFSADDELFLRSQRGFQPAMLAELRSSRRRVAREYLAALKVDFLTLHRLSTQLLALAPADQPELASRLASMKLEFYWGLSLAHTSLVLHALGVDQIRPLAGLAELFQGLHQHTQLLTASQANSFAA
ncbi:MAG: hypothetical protein NTZ56_15725 [Acidobacteria bacterium]|nr:hypothetical protein [Acidobacteriota bacterium]